MIPAQPECQQNYQPGFRHLQGLRQLSAIKEVDGVPQAKEMVEIFTRGHEQVVKTCPDALIICKDAGDESSAALISARMRIHEKTAWMLRAIQ